MNHAKMFVVFLWGALLSSSWCITVQLHGLSAFLAVPLGAFTGVTVAYWMTTLLKAAFKE